MLNPGDIDEIGWGNTAFNARRSYRYGYEIMELYRLSDPISYAKFRTVCRGRATVGWQFARKQLILRAPIDEMERVL